MPFLTSASNNRSVLKKNQLKVAWKRIVCAGNKKCKQMVQQNANNCQLTIIPKRKKTRKWDLKTNYGQWMVSEMDKAQAYSDENYY